MRAEKKSRAWLEDRGYFVVEARGSHGACDLVAIGGDDVLVIQVKSGRKPTPSERSEIRKAMAKIPNTEVNDNWCVGKVLHYWPKYAREPIVEAV